jgi:hypothetical protein
MTVTRKPDRRGEHENKLLKPLRAGMLGVSGGPVVTTLVWLFYFPREAAGALGTRHSPRPLLGGRFMQGSGASRRENADARLDRHCEERSDEAIHSSRSKAGLLRFARNDV